MGALLHDLRLALRQLSRRPGFAAIAVLTLAVGMGVNTVAFGVVNGLLLKGFTTAAGPGVGRLKTTPTGDENGYASLPEYSRFEEATRGRADLAAEGRLALAWRHDGETDTAWGLLVSPGYFGLVPVEPVAGVNQVTGGRGRPLSAVVGERYWRQRLAAAPLAGLTLNLNGVDVAVTGVLPEAFTGPGGIYAPDVWLPLEGVPELALSPSLRARDSRWLFLLARPSPGVPPAALDAAAAVAADGMARDWPGTHTGRGAHYVPPGAIDGELGGLRTAAAVAMAVIGLVLLLACFNVATLLLARAADREREMGIRAALGAGGPRLLRMALAEGLLLSMLAGVLTLLLAWWTSALVGTFAIPTDQPQHIDLSPDGRIVVFVLVLVLAAGLLPAIWPARRAARVDVMAAIGVGAGAAGARTGALRRWLVTAQIAGATAFLASAVLLLQSYGVLSDADPGYDVSPLVVSEFEPAAHGLTGPRARQFAETLAERVAGQPGVTHAALAIRAPFFIGYDRQVEVRRGDAPCGPGPCPAYPVYGVGPGFFAALGVPLASGAGFSAAGIGEVIVNESLGRQLWPEGSPVGELVRLGADGAMTRVVGVVSRLHMRGLDHETPALFVPMDDAAFAGSLSLVVRGTGQAAPIADTIRTLAAELSPGVPVTTHSMEDRMAVQLWPIRTLTWLFGTCAALAVVLAVVGLAAVVLHAVSRRGREFGVRVAVGATPGALARGVLMDGVRLLLPGLGAGLLLAAAAARFGQATLVGVDLLSPLTWIGVAVTQAVIVLLACLPPAIRASRTDPVRALNGP
ncbi:MAG: FtsX-like permease family protein [Vicinamibacterales bacterium]